MVCDAEQALCMGPCSGLVLHAYNGSAGLYITLPLGGMAASSLSLTFFLHCIHFS